MIYNRIFNNDLFGKRISSSHFTGAVFNIFWPNSNANRNTFELPFGEFKAWFLGGTIVKFNRQSDFFELYDQILRGL